MISDMLAFFIGYCAAIIFPVPWISRAVLDGWARLGAWFKSKTGGGVS